LHIQERIIIKITKELDVGPESASTTKDYYTNHHSLDSPIIFIVLEDRLPKEELSGVFQ
jgi:hypothetical protein